MNANIYARLEAVRAVAWYSMRLRELLLQQSSRMLEHISRMLLLAAVQANIYARLEAVNGLIH